jgi:hypothetical protein
LPYTSRDRFPDNLQLPCQPGRRNTPVSPRVGSAGPGFCLGRGVPALKMYGAGIRSRETPCGQAPAWPCTRRKRGKQWPDAAMRGISTTGPSPTPLRAGSCASPSDRGQAQPAWGRHSCAGAAHGFSSAARQARLASRGARPTPHDKHQYRDVDLTPVANPLRSKHAPDPLDSEGVTRVVAMLRTAGNERPRGQT